MTNDKKKEILEMLANKEISKEEAERKLAELGETVTPPEPDSDPVQQPTPPPKKSNTGCIVAIIIAAVLLPILLVISVALFVLLMKADSPRSVQPYRVPEAIETKDYTSSASEDSSSLDPKEIKALDVEELEESDRN